MEDEKLKSLEWETNELNIPFKIHMICGIIAGCAEHFIMFPFDNIKTNMQVFKTKYNIFQTIKNIVRISYLNLFNGLQSILIGVIPAHAAYFSIYE